MSPAVRRAEASAACLLVLALCAPARGEVTGQLGRALAAVAGRSTLTLVTTGRRTGRPRPVALWFVFAGGRLYVQSGRQGHTNWYRNLLKNPRVEVRLGDLSLSARARPIGDPREVERIHRLFRQKYWMAWIASYLGSSLGQGLPVELEELAPLRSEAATAAAGRGSSK